jgi:hypothetical protein
LPFQKAASRGGRKLLDPAVDVRMIDLDAALFHHFLQVPIAEWIGQIPAHTEQDNVFFYAVSFEVDHGYLSGEKFYACSISQPAHIELTQQNRLFESDGPREL